MGTKVLIYSYYEPESFGGFNWALDTPESRAELTTLFNRDADERNASLMRLVEVDVDFPSDLDPSDIADVTNFLDEPNGYAELVEAGTIGTDLIPRIQRLVWDDEVEDWVPTE